MTPSCLFKWVEGFLKNILFGLCTKKENEAHEKKLKSRFEAAVTVKNTRQYHWFRPSKSSKIACKIFSMDDTYIVNVISKNNKWLYWSKTHVKNVGVHSNIYSFESLYLCIVIITRALLPLKLCRTLPRALRYLNLNFLAADRDQKKIKTALQTLTNISYVREKTRYFLIKNTQKYPFVQKKSY